MAIRYRQGRASPWQVYWNNPLTGKRECANFLTEQEAKKHDSLIKHRIRFERESFRKEEAEEEENASAVTLEQAYFLYLKQKQFSKKGLEWQMDAMRYPLSIIGQKPLADITRTDLESIKTSMLAMPVKSASVRGRLSVLRTVMYWCAEQGFCERIRFPSLPAAHYERFVPPSPEELSRLMDAAAPHIQRVIVLGSQCGVRIGPCELLQLTWDDVDLLRGILRVHGSRKNHAAPWREVPIRESLIPVLAQWQATDAKQGIKYLIHHKGKSVSKINKAWGRTLERAGITRRIRPYDLRHAFATEAIAAGVDIGTVASLMGHSSPTMLLAHYQYVLDGQKRAAVEALPGVPVCAQKNVPKKKGPAAVTVRP